MASRVCSVATSLFVCLFILIHLARCDARATHSHCAPACHCYQVDGLRAANCSSLHNISDIAHSVEVLRVEEFGDHLSLKDGLFSPLVNLKRLYLSHLGLHKVYPAAFSGLRQLQVLDLSHNRFAVPSELAKAVNQLPKLERFLLRGNPLGKVPFLTSKQLAFLDLGSCKISNISDSSLKNLSGLKHLKLDNNRLTVIKPKWFPQSIVSLDLSNNYIRHFSRHEFHNLSHLEHVEISGNPIHCTCETLKIRYDFIMNNVVLCVYPKEYRGVDLFSLKKRDFCPKTDSDNRIRRHIPDDEQEYEDEDDYYNDEEGDEEKTSGEDVHGTEQGNEGSAKSDVSKPVEPEDVHTHSSEHVQDAPPLGVDSPSRDEDKEQQQDTDTFPASEEDKEMGESPLADESTLDSEGDEDKENTDNEEENHEAESVVSDLSNKDEHVDLAPHTSGDDGDKHEEDTDNSPVNEDEKDDGESVIEDSKNKDVDAASHASEADVDKDGEDTDNSPINEDEKDDGESVIEDSKNKDVDAASHASEADVDKDGEDTDNSPVNRDDNNSPASKEETDEAEDTSVKNDHIHAAAPSTADDGDKDEENTDNSPVNRDDNNSPASKEETVEAENVLDDTSVKNDQVDLAPDASEADGDKDGEDADSSPANENEKDDGESVVEDNKNQHTDAALHASEGVVTKEEEDSNDSQASVEEADDMVDDKSNKHQHGSADDGNKDEEEDTDNSPASEEVKEMVGGALDDTSSKNEHVDTAPHSSEDTDNSPANEEGNEEAESVLDDTSAKNQHVDAAGEENKEDEDTGDEKEEAVNVSENIAVAEKEEDATNNEEIKHEQVVSTLDESSPQNKDQDIPSHVSGGDSLEETSEENKEDGAEGRDEMKESHDEIKNEDNMESEHHKEEEGISEVDVPSLLEEHASHATVSENEPKETGEEVDDSLNELSKEDVAGNAFESSGEVEKEGQEESEKHTNNDNEETHILLSPAGDTRNETSDVHHADHSSRMEVFGSDEDQVEYDTEVDELHDISSNEHKPQDSEDEDHEGNTDTEVDQLHNIKDQDNDDRGVEDNVDDEEEQVLHEHHEVDASERNETHTTTSSEDEKEFDELMKWNAESSGSVESQEEGEYEEEIENHNQFFGLPPTSENATEPSVVDAVESPSNETHFASERNETAIFMEYEESKAAYDLSEELEDISGKHDYMFEEIEGSGVHEDSTPILLEGSGFEESVTESSTEDTSESSGYAPLSIGVHSVIHTSNQAQNDTETKVVDDLERTTVSAVADNSLELEEESSGHGSFDEIPIIPPVEPHDHDSDVTTEKEPVVEEEIVPRVNVNVVEGAGPHLVQTTTHQPEMEESSTHKAAEVEIEGGSGANETHGDIKQESGVEQEAAQDSASNSAGSYIVLGVIMCIIVILLGYAVIRSHQKRKRSPRKDVENPGRELQDVSKPLIDSKPPPGKEEPVDETREPLMSKEKEAALSSELPDKEPLKNGDLNHVPEVVVEKQPLTETDSPAPAQNKDANGTAKKPEPNGTLTAPLVNGNGVAAPVSPSSGRVKVVAKELPDSVAKRPILIVNRGTDPTV
ncbi:dentin sialophosphoprotein [Anabrus simplex]|uniref:dentin sialophosphoprotein n=1 Tax=Anabrus simplex TaxID=316456 RepID=UPI0035A3248B